MGDVYSTGQSHEGTTLNTNANDVLAATLTMNGRINKGSIVINTNSNNNNSNTIGSDKMKKSDNIHSNFSSFLRPSSTSFNSLLPSAPTLRITSSSTVSSSSSPMLAHSNNSSNDNNKV